jgi:hypothetical protein
MVNPSDIQPVADAAPVAPIEPQAAPSAEDEQPAGPSLPEEVLKIPAMSALLQGAPPATYGPLKSKMPEIETLSKHAQDLKNAGFAAFKSESMPGNFVLFNGLIIKPDEIMQADKSGQLDSVAVPFETLVNSFESAKKDAEGAPAEGAPPSEVAPGGAIAPPAGSSVPPLPASAQRRTMSARVANLVPGSPTSGPAPGRGRVINAISKPVV